MSLSLPPISIMRCNEENAQLVYKQLTSVIAGHPLALTTYQFYEEVDNWLGPWGKKGYPISYGKFYNIAFTSNHKLMANPTTKQWVWRTTIYLQEAIRDYLVKRIRDGSIRTITEAEFRREAFNTHPKAYDKGGLAMVVLAAPELIMVIAAIPRAEFSPTSDNFAATVEQVFVTIKRILPKMVGASLAALAGPAHNGMFRVATQRDRQRYFNNAALSQSLGRLKTMIEQGRLDHTPWLDYVINQLAAKEFPDQGYAVLARNIIKVAKERRRILLNQQTDLLTHSPEVREKIQGMFPRIFMREAVTH